MEDQGQRVYKAFIDPETGLYDRRTMWSRLAEEVSRAQRYSYPFSLMLVAFDAQETPSVIEQVLLLAELLKQHTRSSDILARYSEDALALLLPCTDEEGALQLANRIRHMFPTADEPGAEAAGSTMVSIGVTSTPADFRGDKLALVEQVERTLRQARRQGRGDIVVVSAPGSTPRLGEDAA